VRKFDLSLFRTTEGGKIREQAMMARAVTTVAVIVMCLIAMSVTAYAYFSCNVSSGSGMIQAARFETNVSLAEEHNTAVEVTPITKQNSKASLKAGTTYSVTVETNENCTANTGFVVITASNCAETYHTQQLFANANTRAGNATNLTFTLKVTKDTEVYFLSHWGTSSYYDAYRSNGTNGELYVIEGETIEMNTGESANSGSAEEEEKQSSTVEEDVTAPPVTTKTPTAQTPATTEQSTAEDKTSTENHASPDNNTSTENQTSTEGAGDSSENKTTETSTQATPPASTDGSAIAEQSETEKTD